MSPHHRGGGGGGGWGAYCFQCGSRQLRHIHLSALYLLISLLNGQILTKLTQLYIIGRGTNSDYLLVTLTPFSRSQESLDC